MSRTWLKMEAHAAHDPAIRRSGRWAWQTFETLCRIAKVENYGGNIPEDRATGDEIAFQSNLAGLEDELEAARDRLVENGLLLKTDTGYQIRSWSRHQEDASAAERKRRQRAREKLEELQRRHDELLEKLNDSNTVTDVTVGHGRSRLSRGSHDVTTTLQDTTGHYGREGHAHAREAPPPPSPDGEAPFAMDSAVTAALQYGDADPDFAAARRVYDEGYVPACKKGGCVAPPWASSRSSIVRAVIWTRRMLVEDGCPEEEAGAVAVKALIRSLPRLAGGRGKGRGDWMHQIASVFGGHFDYAEVLGGLLSEGCKREARPSAAAYREVSP